MRLIEFLWFGLELALACCITSPKSVDSFPDIFKHLLFNDRFRFQYEINGLDPEAKSRIRSLLIDESYSHSLGRGRLIVDYSLRNQASGQHEEYLDMYDTFYWSRNDELQFGHWLRPFFCLSCEEKLTESTMKCGLLFSVIPFKLQQFFSYSDPRANGLSLHGLGALFANVLKLRLEEEQFSTYNTEEILGWRLKLKNEYSFEFWFKKSPELEELDDITFPLLKELFVNIVLTKPESSGDQKAEIVAQFNVLRLDHIFPNELLDLPAGYLCKRQIAPPFQLTNSEFVSQIKPTQLIYDISVTSSANKNSPILLYPSCSVPTPSDSILSPKTSSSALVFVYNQYSQIIATITHQVPDGSSVSPDRPINLTVWDFDTKQKHLVHQQKSGTCDQPEAFKNSLFSWGQKAIQAPELKMKCSNEGAEVQLSNSLKLKLDQVSLNLLLFVIQNRENYSQLVSYEPFNETTYELNYEKDLLNEPLCVYNDDELLSSDYARLSTKYLFSPEIDRWEPKSSSLLFFNKPHNRLLWRIDFNLVHYETFKSWLRSRHLIDLSGCKLGPKQSARLYLEYPLLIDDAKRVKGMLNPHSEIRYELMNHLRLTYSLTLLRVPSIEVRISHNLAEVEVHLLDRQDLLLESKNLINTEASREQFMQWLKKATKSTLTSDARSCANYCQQYRCEIYTYCKYFSSCYVFINRTNTLEDTYNGKRFGSFQDLELNCESFEVKQDRSERTRSWTKRSWSLQEVLESLTNSINESPESLYSSVASDRSLGIQPDDPIESSIITQKMSVMKPTLRITDGNKFVTLQPTFAHYKFDDYSEDLLGKEAITSKGNALDWATKFRVASSGYRFVERNASKFEVGEGIRHFDLDDSLSKGYLILNEHEIEDCVRLCLADVACCSFSYCITDSTCIITKFNHTQIKRMQQDDESDSPLKIEPNPRCSVMQRTFSDQFERFEMRKLTSYANESSTGNVIEVFAAADSGDCATRCSRDRVDGLIMATNSTSCLSYDFCEPLKRGDKSPAACILYNKHLVSRGKHLSEIKGDHLKEEMSQSAGELSDSPEDLLSQLRGRFGLSLESSCWHFVRNFLADFTKSNNRRLRAEMKSLSLSNFQQSAINIDDNAIGLEEANKQSNERLNEFDVGDSISLVRCARLCEEDSNCGAFEFCTADYQQAPNGLFLSCSLGNNRTLHLIPVRKNLRQKGQQQRQENALMKSHICAVYTYNSLTLVLGHKKKNLASRIDEDLVGFEVNEKMSSNYGHIVELVVEILIAFVFSVIGFIVRALKLDQFAFRRLLESSEEAQSGGSRARETSQTGSSNAMRLESLREKC